MQPSGVVLTTLLCIIGATRTNNQSNGAAGNGPYQRNVWSAEEEVTYRRARRQIPVSVYVINLKAASERKRYMSKELRDCTYPIHFVEADDGTNTSIPSLKRRPMSQGEIGCFLSHRKVWSKIAQQPAGSWGLVFEDDVVIDGGWEDVLENGIREIDSGLLFCGKDAALPAFYYYNWHDVSDQFTSRRHDEHFSPHCVIAAPRMNMHAYCLDSRSAKILLSELSQIETAVDVQIHFEKVSISRYALKHGFAAQNKSRFTTQVQTRVVKNEKLIQTVFKRGKNHKHSKLYRK